MDYEQDYILRTIRDMIRMIAKLLLGKDTVTYEPEAEASQTSAEDFCSRLISMADNGKINEAENLLYEYYDAKNKETIETALIFYQRLTEYDTEFLAANNYSREEIQLGLEKIARDNNCFGLLEFFHD